MFVDLHAEHLYGQVELVRGSGSRKRGQLCIMSFVAYLAGERHTDHPRTASPFIRRFAIQLNDGISTTLRQDLKPFAPRIIGTNDGYDFERASAVFQMVMDDVLPRAACDFLDNRAYSSFGLNNKSLFTLAAGWCDTGPTGGMASYFRAVRDSYEHGDCFSLATRAGQLFAALVQCAPTSAKERWYWAKAVELLDRLCEVGADDRAARIGSENATSITVPHGAPALAAPSKADLQKAKRRPMQKISRVFRAALDFVSI